MRYDSILMKKIKLSNSELYFGEGIFDSKKLYQIDTRLFNHFDDKLKAIKFIIFNILAILVHKKQPEDLCELWKLIDVERKKDTRVNKEILKNFTESSFFNFHERKQNKLTLKDSRVNYPIRYLDLISRQLIELKYKMKEEEYLLYRSKLLTCIKMLFKTNSEFGYAPVLKHINISYLEKFYHIYPEILDLNISQSDHCDLYFNLMLKIWNLTNNEKYLPELDIAFERMKSSKSTGFTSDVEKNLDLIIANPIYKDKLPHFEKFKNTKNYIQFKERSVIQWDIDIEVLQKWGVGISGVSLSPSKLLTSINWLNSFELNYLELCNPLNNIYMDLSKTNICFVFNKDKINNEMHFEDYWLKILSGIIFEINEDKRIATLETINKEYLLDLSIPLATNQFKSKLIKF